MIDDAKNRKGDIKTDCLECHKNQQHVMWQNLTDLKQIILCCDNIDLEQQWDEIYRINKKKPRIMEPTVDEHNSNVSDIHTKVL